MKKEVLLAIGIGFAIGLLITFGVYLAQRSFQESSVIQSPVAEKPATEITPTEIIPSLSIVSPLDQSISKDGKISLIGVAAPDSQVVILTEKGEKLIQADNKGNFATDISLISGENEIEVDSFTDQGDKVSKTITVVYSTAEI